jgi:hypothetical protein
MVCDLRPGDALVVPGGWWVHTQLLQPNSCALTLQLHPGPERVATKGALLLQLSRCIEAWTAGAVGVANTRGQLLVRCSLHQAAMQAKLDSALPAPHLPRLLAIQSGCGWNYLAAQASKHNNAQCDHGIAGSLARSTAKP